MGIYLLFMAVFVIWKRMQILMNINEKDLKKNFMILNNYFMMKKRNSGILKRNRINVQYVMETENTFQLTFNQRCQRFQWKLMLLVVIGLSVIFAKEKE